MVVKCEVKFENNPNGVYFAGQTLAGVVELTIDKPKQIRGLILKIEGSAKVEWSETHQHHNPHHHHHNSFHNNNNFHNNVHHNHTTTSQTIHFSGREDFIGTKFYLMGSAEGNQIDLSPGHYRYNFQTVLPAQIPTSCEAPYGAIRYLVTVILDRPFKFDMTYKLAFTVIKQLDLNYENPAILLPIKMEAQKTFCCGICTSKPLLLSASIPMGGYVPGQAINVAIEVNNQSNTDVDYVKTTLKKIFTYHAQIPYTWTKQDVVTEVEGRFIEGVKKRSRKSFNHQLFIPAVPPTNNQCRVLTVAYQVQVKCKIKGPSSGPILIFPIIIGTVPLNSNQNAISLPGTTPSITEMTYDQMLMTPSITGQSNPPPYTEAIFTQGSGNSGIELADAGEHTMGSLRPFNPMYPVYYGREVVEHNPNGSAFVVSDKY